MLSIPTPLPFPEVHAVVTSLLGASHEQFDKFFRCLQPNLHLHSSTVIRKALKTSLRNHLIEMAHIVSKTIQKLWTHYISNKILWCKIETPSTEPVLISRWYGIQKSGWCLTPPSSISRCVSSFSKHCPPSELLPIFHQSGVRKIGVKRLSQDYGSELMMPIFEL